MLHSLLPPLLISLPPPHPLLPSSHLSLLPSTFLVTPHSLLFLKAPNACRTALCNTLEIFNMPYLSETCYYLIKLNAHRL